MVLLMLNSIYSTIRYQHLHINNHILLSCVDNVIQEMKKLCRLLWEHNKLRKKKKKLFLRSFIISFYLNTMLIVLLCEQGTPPVDVSYPKY